MFIHDYAKLLMPKNSFILEKTPELRDFIAHKAHEIFHNKKPGDKRTVTQVFWDTENSAPEFIMHQINPNFVKNPWNENFNSRDPKTFAWDVNYGDDTFELKRWPDDDRTSWFSYSKEHLGTMLKYINLIDYVVCPRTIKHDDVYEVYFPLIAKAKSFSRYLKRSNYQHKVYTDQEIVYYNHFFAERDGDCIFDLNIKHRS
jgi:hypothetical protein